MGIFACENCGLDVDYTGPGRPRFCDGCKPARYTQGQCIHGSPRHIECPDCAAVRAYQRRLPTHGLRGSDPVAGCTCVVCKKRKRKRTKEREKAERAVRRTRGRTP